jgi:NitT/TauT family transport system permease protein
VLLPLAAGAAFLVIWHLAVWLSGGPFAPCVLQWVEKEGAMGIGLSRTDLANAKVHGPVLGLWTDPEQGSVLVLTAQHSNTLFPNPVQVAFGILELGQHGLLFKYVVASLFRVTWGFTLAVLVGVPFGLFLGWFRPAQEAFNPMIQAFRPISPIAWIPVAILWFGVSDAAPIFLIFLASVFPITVSTTAAVKNVQLVHLRAAHNFGLTGMQLFRRVILPATLPQILTGLRIALGVAWLVVVAAEMIAVKTPAIGMTSL